ncbi:MAG TPA: aromatic ring-hydroxylating dioxygenase subunit alpha [Acidimicrobiia bacterium]|jgi:phenylpropionate dioxygenase-like ring-hydroxylating dioxygenase large terminal subunit
MAILDDARSRPRSSGISPQEILQREAQRQEVPDVLLSESYAYLGSDDIPVERYTSADYARLEAERLWPKVWQMACREEEIPEVGDHVVYDIANYSILVVRSAPDVIKAYHNSCLHRGTQLRAEGGSVPFFRCSFHGWTWNLDGTLKRIPAQWDFPHCQPDQMCLPECQVGTWAGFVFVNMDPDAGPLEDWLEVLPEHFRHWPLEKRLKAAHVAKVLPCNWKVAVEAFIEAYHVSSTHPQLAFYDGDTNSQYDIYGEHVSRFVNILGIPSPELGELDEQTIAEAFARDFRIGDVAAVEVPEGSSAREVIADTMRQLLSAGSGIDFSKLSNTEAIDSIEYYLFPNFLPWAGLGIPIVYRFRPNGLDPDTSIMEVMLMAPLPEGLPQRPPPAPIHWLESDDWRDAPEIGVLGLALNQDMSNLHKVQRGLHASATKAVRLGDYQEIRIRHYHRTLAKYVGK